MKVKVKARDKRDSILYVRIKKTNKSYVVSESKKANMRFGEYVDALLDALRKK